MHAILDRLAHLIGVGQHLDLLLFKLLPDPLLPLLHVLGHERTALWPKLKLEVWETDMGSSLSLWIPIHPHGFQGPPPTGLLITSLLIYDNLKFRSRLRGNGQERLLHQPTTVQGLLFLINHFLKKKRERRIWTSAWLSSSSLIIYHAYQASYLCISKLSFSFLHLGQFSTFYLSCFRCHKISPRVSLMWSVLPVSFPLRHLHPASQTHFPDLCCKFVFCLHFQSLLKDSDISVWSDVYPITPFCSI